MLLSDVIQRLGCVGGSISSNAYCPAFIGVFLTLLLLFLLIVSRLRLSSPYGQRDTTLLSDLTTATGHRGVSRPVAHVSILLESSDSTVESGDEYENTPTWKWFDLGTAVRAISHWLSVPDVDGRLYNDNLQDPLLAIEPQIDETKAVPLGKSLREDHSLVVCAVGIGDKKLPGPRKDVALLREIHTPREADEGSRTDDAQAIGPNGGVHPNGYSSSFYCIRARHTTQARVSLKIRRALERAAQQQAMALFYFTGHSNEFDDFWINTEQSISVFHILAWIDAFRTNKQLPIILVLDHCRIQPSTPALPILDHHLDNIFIFRACSLGEEAHEVVLKKGLPSSQFFKAGLLALAEAQSPSASAVEFVKLLAIKMANVANILCTITFMINSKLISMLPYSKRACPSISWATVPRFSQGDYCASFSQLASSGSAHAVSYYGGGDQRVCVCGRVNPFVAQASAPSSPGSRSVEASPESDSGGGMNIKHPPERPPSPGRVSKISTRPVQGDGPNDSTAENSWCSSCGQATPASRNDKLARGSSKSVVQNETFQTLGDQRHTPALTSPITSNPLRRSLNEGSSSGLEPPTDDDVICWLNILIVAKSDEGGDRPLKGPKLDTDYITEDLRNLPNVSVESISDYMATRARIDEAIECLWRTARDKSHLLILFTSHGGTRGMTIEDGEIDEEYIQALLQRLNDFYPKELRVISVFDICRDRMDANRVPVKMDHYISLIWSCSIGQEAKSLEFRLPKPCEGLAVYYHFLRNWWLSWWYTPGRHDLSPGSYFLLAAVKAYQDVTEKKGLLKERFKVRMKQLVRFQSYLQHTSAIDGIPNCTICIRDEVWCPNAFDALEQYEQTIDLERYWGHLNRLVKFLQERDYTASLPDVASKFFLRLDAFDKRYECGSQLRYILQSPTDFAAWWGWLKWLIGSIWLIWLFVIQTLDRRRPVADSSVPVKEGHAHPAEPASVPATAHLKGLRLSEPRGMQVPVVSASAPVQPANSE
ncbi:hypothetical protein RhiJN_18082 [Ceratobasidium sp. AG-Ba]|nr:hypothetical protein RhiJN_18082 [Ceratobasidium sp. AG-Ba]